jgi:hypothetical protein
MDKFDGKLLNSPNDIVVKSDDTIWFTDPPFAILNNYDGQASTPELLTNVYRLDKTGRVHGRLCPPQLLIPPPLKFCIGRSAGVDAADFCIERHTANATHAVRCRSDRLSF